MRATGKFHYCYQCNKPGIYERDWNQSTNHPGCMWQRCTVHTPRITIHELLKAVATGDADLLAQILGVWPTATAVEERCLLQGVTAEGSSALHIAAGHGHLELVVMICTQDISLIKVRNNRLSFAPQEPGMKVWSITSSAALRQS